YAARHGLSDHHVHRAVRGRAHGGLDRAVEGDDRGPAPEARASPPALHRRAAARISADLAAAVFAPASISGGLCRRHKSEMAERGAREHERLALAREL